MDFVRHDTAIKLFYSNLDSFLERGIFENRKIIMFGTSKIASMIIYYLKVRGIDTVAIVDNDVKRQGTIVFGINVYSPDKYLRKFDEQNLILIASSYQDSMIKQLEKMGYQYETHVIKVIDLPKVMNDYSFVDRTGLKKMTREDIRAHQMNVLKYYKKICDENNLRYFLCGGTLLGAVRYKGYIPWDDDIDVYMEMKDLKKLVKILKNDTNFGIASFVDEEADYYDECSLMYERNSIMDSNHFPMQISAGISIDIFPLVGLPDDEDELKEYISVIKELEADKWNKLYDKYLLRKASKKLVDYMSSFDFDDHKTCGFLLSRYFMREIMPSSYFKGHKEVEFEGEFFHAPLCTHEYLEHIHGVDYMTPPPKELQVAGHYYNAYYK